MLGDTTTSVNSVELGSQNDPGKLTKSQLNSEGKQENTPPEQAFVKRWQEKVKRSKEKFATDFERMRDNLDFVAGIQWHEQTQIRDKEERYVCNMTLKAVNQGVATLYAKDPQVSVTRREKLNYALWDGKIETLQMAQQIYQMGMQHGFPVPPDIIALINDHQQGRMKEMLLDRVAKTLEVLLTWEKDSQQPNFKTQMKQAVRRINTCGVAYVKVMFVRDYETELTQSETRDCTMDRAKAARNILDRLEEGDLTEDSPEVEQLKSLVFSLGLSPDDYENVQVKERLVFDFPQATSIIPDYNTRSLKGLIGCRWIAEEFYLPLNYVNSFFEVNIKIGGDLKIYGEDNKELRTATQDQGQQQDEKEGKVRIWEITNLDDRSKFVICDGWNDFVSKPEPIEDAVKGFWQIIPLTFNDVEVEDGCKATIFPPSTVDLMFSPQKEWNKIRQRLSRHRRANGPKYMYRDGEIGEDDLERVEGSEDQEIIKLKNIPPEKDITKVITALPTVPIDRNLYDSAPVREDVMLGSGVQESNLGPAQPNVTATVGTIAEQSRMSVAQSDVDGLDDGLTSVFECAGQLCLKNMSTDTVTHIVGIGAVWPEDNREDYINDLNLSIVAASSGRPNKAIDLANWEKISNLLITAGANSQAIIRESLKRLDDKLEPEEFFPLPVPQMPQAPTAPTQPQGAPNQPPGLVQGAGVPPMQPTVRRPAPANHSQPRRQSLPSQQN